MLLREKRTGLDVEGTLSTEPTVSACGVPVLVVDGVALRPAEVGNYDLVEVSEGELVVLELAGYRFSRTAGRVPR